MQTHPERPFTIAKLADIAGVGQRSARMSPTGYLSQVRLDRVYQQLSLADPSQVTVAEAASG
jgi:transcriptional regulator GlxA family with amidase domain